MKNQNAKKLDIAQFVERAYLEYSMYVILDRALPFIGDGLKPVQRRIIYAMSELGLKAAAKYKKSARTIGDVLGKFHPHGDSACYEAMVLMAQDFSMRYPLICGQGNWGSIDDPKSFAAMRYTEAKLSNFSDLLLAEIDQGTTKWVANFDASLDEPLYLPAKIPHILLNGTSGIAVGMSTDIPPHNIGEVVDACLYLLKKPQAKIDELLQFIKGPDYPTGGILVSSDEQIKQIYQSGSGSIRLRANYKKTKEGIVINEVPYQTPIIRIMEQLACQIQEKKITWLKTIRDESDHQNPVRLLLVPKSRNIPVEKLMDHLFASTDLEKSYRVQFNMIGLDRKPQTKNLAQILSQWLIFRKDILEKRLQYRADQIADRLHILAGLLIAHLNIDEVIAIIRTEDEPKAVLMKRFNLTSIQASAILDIRLRNLAKLEEIKLQAEQKILSEELDKINDYLSCDSKLKKMIALELKKCAQDFKQNRKTQIRFAKTAKAMPLKQLKPSKDISVVLSRHGWIKLIESNDIDLNEIIFKQGDDYLIHSFGKSTDNIHFLDNQGKCYSLNAEILINTKIAKGLKSQGVPLSKFFNISADVQFISNLQGKNEDCYLLVSSNGYGFITELKNFDTRVKNGKTIINLANTNNQTIYPLSPIHLQKDHQYAAFLSQANKILIIDLKQIPKLNKGKGNKLIKLNDSTDRLISYCLLKPNDNLRLIYKSKSKLLKPQEWKTYLSNRALKGKKIPTNFKLLEKIENA